MKMYGVCTALIVALAPWALGNPITLSDLNTTVDFDLGNSVNMYNWTVDGTDHLYQQGFWYRVGDSGSEAPVSTLPVGNPIVSDINENPGDETLSVKYGSAGAFYVSIAYQLTGGEPGSKTSSINETITIKNNGTSALNFHFFQYVDLDLNNTAGDDMVRILAGNTAVQNDPSFYASETVVTPAPGHFEVNTAPAILNSLLDAAATTLSDAAGPLGPANATWAFQWDFSIPAGGTVQISKVKHVEVPEPASLGLMGLGCLALLRRGRQRP